VDAEGYLWTARWSMMAGWCALCARRTVDRLIGHAGCEEITSVMCGGPPNLDHPVVTSMGAATRLQSFQVTGRLLRGSLFRSTISGIRGLPESRFGR